MQKNVKGFIGLFAGLASVVCIILAFSVRMEKINGTSFRFWGSTNLIFGVIACILAIVAIVFGFMSKRDSDKKGPRKAGIIIGFIAVFISFFAMALGGLCGMIVDYFNNGEKSEIYEQLKPEDRKTFDDLHSKLIEEFPE